MILINYIKKNTIVIFTIVCFTFNIIYFVYALGFFTNFVPTQDPYPNFYESAQDVNHFIFNGAIISLIFGLIVLGLKLGKLDRFHFIHYFFVLAWTGINGFVSFITIYRLGNLKELYFALDFTNPEFTRFTPTGYTPSHFLFDFGWILSLFMIIFSCLLLLNILFIYMKNRKGGVR